MITDELPFMRPMILREMANPTFERHGAVADVEAAYLAAARCAQEQLNRLEELLATMDYARWLSRIKPSDQASQILERAYSGFTEGFTTAPLMDAKALLDQLSGQAHRLRPRRNGN